eukprot:s6889_g1.t1
MMSKVNAADAKAAYQALMDFKDVVKAPLHWSFYGEVVTAFVAGHEVAARNRGAVDTDEAAKESVQELLEQLSDKLDHSAREEIEKLPVHQALNILSDIDSQADAIRNPSAFVMAAARRQGSAGSRSRRDPPRLQEGPYADRSSYNDRGYADRDSYDNHRRDSDRSNGYGRQDYNSYSQNNGYAESRYQRRRDDNSYHQGYGRSEHENQKVEQCLPSLTRPQITVTSLHAGDNVEVFHRYCQDPNGYFMVQHRSSGILHPSVGKTDGWTTARVNENWDVQYYNPADYKTWVEIQWTHPVTQRVMPEQLRKSKAQTEPQRPQLSLLHLRWGGEQTVNPVVEGAGGWGQTGSNPSDNYINTWEDVVFRTLGPNYEIISAFIQNSEELGKLAPALLRHLLTGHHDGHEFPAYVQKERLLELMVQMEAAGVPSRFPHESHLYKIFASKEWTAQMCLHPLLHVPLTTMVPRQAVASDPGKAAADAMMALKNLAEARSAWNGQLGQAERPYMAKGVAKLGWSWEAMDVQAWKSSGRAFFRGFRGGCEWVDFEVEMRHFLVDVDLKDRSTWKPKHIVYTVFKSKEDGCFRNFDKYDAKTAAWK